MRRRNPGVARPLVGLALVAIAARRPPLLDRPRRPAARRQAGRLREREPDHLELRRRRGHPERHAIAPGHTAHWGR